MLQAGSPSSHVRLKVAGGFAHALSKPRRDGRVVEGARLESVYRGNSIEGSNPSLSAIHSKGSTPSMGQPLTDSRTHYPNSQSVVLDVSKAVSRALEDFHFGMEPTASATP